MWMDNEWNVCKWTVWIVDHPSSLLLPIFLLLRNGRGWFRQFLVVFVVCQSRGDLWKWWEAFLKSKSHWTHSWLRRVDCILDQFGQFLVWGIVVELQAGYFVDDGSKLARRPSEQQSARWLLCFPAGLRLQGALLHVVYPAWFLQNSKLIQPDTKCWTHIQTVPR